MSGDITILKEDRPFVIECKLEPRGNNGLEGFAAGDKYWAQKVTTNKNVYYRVWLDERLRPTKDAGEFRKRGYYETCGPKVFGLYFRTLKGSNRTALSAC